MHLLFSDPFLCYLCFGFISIVNKSNQAAYRLRTHNVYFTQINEAIQKKNSRIS